MNSKNVIIIPTTLSNQSNRYLGTPGKTHVVGYARVEKGTGAGVQIRKNIRQLIADQPEWELVYVTTDYYQTQNQDLTYRSFFNICKTIRSGCVDVLIIYSANNWEEDYAIAEWLFQLCREYGIKGYIARNNSLFSVCDFRL
ncbi:hypothetical protein [Clostridium tagluense]|uniref:hypothetical protein n=1 Tax=Clostridium tagluense TaxID=360422 RepID=UPI001C0C5689|nr:hypothetical protein [Clostridium tagluense]MBU3130626.1 hypothetical protein [Clostridium tagluense]